jgi:hypothetical protein
MQKSKLMKQQFDKTTSQLNGKLMKEQVDERAS